MIGKNDIDIEVLLKEQELYDNPLTEKQADILRAAEKLFTESGFSETATASIAKEANVTEKTLFKHFPTKSHLLRRILFPLLLRTILPHQMRKIKSVIQEDYGSYEKFFEVFAVERWTIMRTMGPRLKFLLIELLQNEKLRQQFSKIWVANMWKDIIENVEKHQKSGDLRSDVSAELIAQMQIMVIAGHAFYFAILARDKDLNAEERAKMVAKLFYEGVGARK